MELKFKSSKYKRVENINNIAVELNKLCNIAELNHNEKKYVFKNWINNSKYNMSAIELSKFIDSVDDNKEITSSEIYKILNKLNYDYDRYSKLKRKLFFQELNYKKFINQAMNFLEYELEKEEKQIINDLEHELTYNE